jgi:hypothetical protein
MVVVGESLGLRARFKAILEVRFFGRIRAFQMIDFALMRGLEFFFLLLLRTKELGKVRVASELGLD